MVKQTIKTPQEYKEAVEAAETLGLEPSDWSFFGVWEVHYQKKPENKSWKSFEVPPPSWPKGSEVVEVGTKYITVEMDGNLSRIKPGEKTDGDMEPKLKVSFTG